MATIRGPNATSAVLLAAGFHQHKRANGGNDVAEATKPVKTHPRDHDEMMEMLKRAESGDDSTLPALRDLLRSGATHEFVEILGRNLVRQVEERLIANGAGKSLLYKEAVTRKLELTREELAGTNPAPLEKLLIDRIALCWLALHDAELLLARSKELTFQQAEYHQNRIDRAHRRYLTVIRTLATIRKLALPVVQVNIAKRQTNIAGAAPVIQTEKEAE
jgi:hypothetical protein